MSDKSANIKIKGGKTVSVQTGDTLFKSLRSARIFIPTICAGKGFCGACKIKVLSGATAPLTESERKKLSEDEIAQGVRLSCQLPVDGDMTIELPEETKDVRIYSSVVTEIEMMCHDTRRIHIKLTEPEEMDYLPGAFVLVDIPPSPGRRLGITRSYSIATPPSSKSEIEFNVKLVPNGVGSSYIHNSLEVGDTLNFVGPYSGYPSTGDSNELICVAGGSGISPVLSLLRHMNEKQIPRKVSFFFGVRTCDDLEYMDELHSFERTLPNFNFHPVVEKMECSLDEDIIIGQVTSGIAQVVKDAAGCSAYLCGSSGMLEACCKQLVGLGIKQDDIFFDRFS